ncbi:MAG: immune inhibitor A domain-containing protein [Eggerthella lenta]
MQRKTGEPARTVRRAPLLVFFMLAFSLCLAPSAAYAGPALEIEQGYVQPDGATFQAGQRGDEFFHYVRTTEGLLVQKSPADQTWYYVTSEGFGLALGPRADEAAPANALTPSVLANDTGKMAYSALGGGAYVPRDRGVGEAVTLSDIEAAQAASGANALGARSAAQTETSLPLITIVIGFENPEDPGAEVVQKDDDGNVVASWNAADQRYRDGYDWNKLLYSGENSITSYYATMSNGKFSWTPATEETSAYGTGGNTNLHDKAGDGVIHVTLKRDHGNWESVEYLSDAAKDQRDAYVDALNEASQYIDFATYDTNRNGVLEPTEAGLLFIVAGYEASGAGGTPSTWACRWELSSMDRDNFEPEEIVNPETGSKIEVNDYISIGETLMNDMIPAQPMPTSTVAHELGHYLGLPDLYDIHYTANDPEATVDQFPWLAYDVSELSLMAGGSWGRYITDSGDTVFVPVSLDPYCLERLGYIEPVEVAADGTHDASTFWSGKGYQCLRVPTSTEGEYYLVENRQYESFDLGLTSGYRVDHNKEKPQYYNETGGIVIWHIDRGIADARSMTDDPLLSNTVNTVDHRPGVMPVYPENTEYRDGQALYTRPFFNTSACETFGMEGNVVPLLQYNGCDTPDERVDSGIVLSVGDTVGDVMSVTVDLPEPDQPGGGYEESSHVGEIAGSRVEVSGSFPAGAELSLALSALTDEQKAEMAKASDQLGALIVSADASVVDAATSEKAAHEGKLSVSFSVDKRYEGKSVWMVHRKADGSLEATKAAVEGGLASMTVDELSPFAVFEQKAAIPGDDGNVPPSGSPGGEEPSGDTQVEPLPGKALASTGDSAAAPAALALAIAAAVAAMIAQTKLRRRHDSQTQ